MKRKVKRLNLALRGISELELYCFTLCYLLRSGGRALP